MVFSEIMRPEIDMDLSELFRSWGLSPRVLAGAGMLLVLLAAAGFFYWMVWRRRWRSPLGIGLFVLFIVGIAMAGFGAYFPTRPKPVSMDSHLVDTPGPEPTQTVNQKELDALQKASMEVPRARFDPATPWPQWRGPNRDGISAETGMRTDWSQSPPKIVWKHPIGEGYSSFAVAHGRLYTMDGEGNTERIVCLSADSGEEIWSHRYTTQVAKTAHHGPKATPTIFEGLIYTIGAFGDFYCLSEAATQGKPQVIWKHDLQKEFEAEKSNSGYGFSSSPLVEGDLVCVQAGGQKGSVVAFDRKNGKVIWTALSDMNGYSSPVAATIADIRQIICFTSKGVAGLKVADGATLWYYDWASREEGCNIATPVVVGDYVFISSSQGAGCVLLRISKDDRGAFKAEPVYVMRNKVMRNYYSSCIFHEGFLYGFDVGPGNLKCIDFRTGAERWADKTRPKGTLIYADGHLIVLTESGTLKSIKASPEGIKLDGKVENIVDTRELWTLPVIANGRLYLRESQSILCLDVKKPVN
jgi:outer membrane protein assembly factor BamB